MKTSMLCKPLKLAQALFFTVITLLISNTLFAQSWNSKTPNILYGVDKNNDTATVKVGIGTAFPQAPLQVRGEIKADSIKVSRIIPKDSLITFGTGSDGIVINNTTNVISFTTATGTRVCSPGVFAPIRGFALGNNGTLAIGQNSMAIGTSVSVPCSVTQAMVLGSGISPGMALVNRISNSMMIGFNSDIPTVFVSPSAGSGTAGKVGIGTTTPLTALHVATVGTNIGYITSDPLSPAGIGPLPATDGLVVANGSGTMVSKLNFSGSSSDVLTGNGTFAPLTSVSVSTAWVLGGNANALLSSKLGTTTAVPLNIYTNNLQKMTIQVNGQVGIGTGFAPAHLLDVNGGDIDVNTPANGYMINSQYVLWHNGITSDIFVGVGAGIASPSGIHDVFVGNQSGNLSNTNNNTFIGYTAGINTSTDSNTFVGTNSGIAVNTGTDNTFVGAETGLKNNSGGLNTFVGNLAGKYNLSGSYNAFLGWAAGYSNTSGPYNTFTGVESGFYNQTGDHNECYGKKAGFYNTDGVQNCYYGAHSSYYNLHGNYNCYFGNNTGYNDAGSDNVMIGWLAGGSGGPSTSFPYPTQPGYEFNSSYNVFVGYQAAPTSVGSYNTVVGAEADAVKSITNAGVFGDTAWVVNSNNLIIGNNTQMVGIGLSRTTLGPQANLEIRTDRNNVIPAGPYPTTNGFLGVGLPATANPYGGTGFSGLKFRDLNSTSTVCTTNYLFISIFF